MDPLLQTILIGGGIFFVSFMLGRFMREIDKVKAGVNTILWLCDNGYLKHTRGEDGAIYLEKLDGKEEET